MTQPLTTPEAWAERGSALLRQHKLGEAVEALTQSLQLKPDDPEVRVLRAIANFLAGDFENGWNDFEGRHDRNWAKKFYWSRSPRDLSAFSAPDEHSTGILVVAEGGAGDTVQFARFVPLLQKRYPRLPVVFEVQNSLLELIRSFPGFESITVIPRTINSHDQSASQTCPVLDPAINACVALLSLPRLLHFNSLDLIRRDAPPPVFPPRPPRNPGSPLQIGLCWRCDPGNTFDPERDIPFDLLQPLTEIKGVTVTSLLDDVTPAEQARAPLMQLPGTPGQRVPFTTMATLIRKMDLVISCDTVWPNLAATLGVPTIMLTLKTPNWRWGLEGETTAWYPSMGLLRPLERWKVPFEHATTEQRKEIFRDFLSALHLDEFGLAAS